jgi:dolichyldiphosphatase
MVEARIKRLYSMAFTIEPYHSCFAGRRNLYTEFGMPSSHAQFMWFFATYLISFICIRVHRNYNLVDELWKVVVCLGGLVAAMVVSYSR